MLSDAQIENIKSFYNTQCQNLECPVCKLKVYQVKAPIAVTEVSLKHSITVAPGITLMLVSCQNCGHSLLFNFDVLKLGLD